jgi:hypothetical protein
MLLASTILFGIGPSSDVRAANSGVLTGWGTNPMQGAAYTVLALPTGQSVPQLKIAFSGLPTGQSVLQLTIAFSGIGSSATAYCGVGPSNGANYPPTAQNQYSWIPKWGFDMTHAQGTTTVSLSCTTTAVLVAVNGGGSPTLSVPGVATASPTSSTIVSTATTAKSTATTVPSTATTGPPTATTGPGATSTVGDAGNTCGNVGDGAVDQHGISVDAWAPGLRIACGFKGYENGDNPMPAGTHLPAPRPFRFDSAVVMHEAVFGFKVYYRKGSEAPPGYGGANGCGDVRVILHQGGSVAGFTTQFHTYQFALDQCDAAGNHHIIDVAGRIDTGPLFLRHNPDSQRPPNANKTTADTLSCNGTTTFICATVWYSFFNYALPGAGNTGWSHMGFLIENPVTLYDVANPANVHLTGNDGTTTMLRDNQFYVPAHTGACWSTLFNTVSQVNEVVSPGTAGAWTNCADPYFSETQRLEPSYGVDHAHNVPGIKYPN